jgi:hypothetical protein
MAMELSYKRHRASFDQGDQVGADANFRRIAYAQRYVRVPELGRKSGCGGFDRSEIVLVTSEVHVRCHDGRVDATLMRCTRHVERIGHALGTVIDAW